MVLMMLVTSEKGEKKTEIRKQPLNCIKKKIKLKKNRNEFFFKLKRTKKRKRMREFSLKKWIME